MSLPKGLYKKHYNGQEVVVSDYRGLSEEEMLKMLSALKDLILTEKPKARLIHGLKGDTPMAVRIFLRKMGPEIKHVPSKVAIVGLATTQRLLLQSYNRLIGEKMKFYDTEEEALSYLTS